METGDKEKYWEEDEDKDEYGEEHEDDDGGLDLF